MRVEIETHTHTHTHTQTHTNTRTVHDKVRYAAKAILALAADLSTSTNFEIYFFLATLKPFKKKKVSPQILHQ